MRSEREEYIDIIKSLDGDIEGRRYALERIVNSDVTAHGDPVRFPYVPYLFSQDDVDFLSSQAEMAHGILCKVIRRYLDDPEYRKLFGFPPEVERLILLPCGYDQLLPIGRFDLFLDEKTRGYKFCEFNTDGSGAMSRDFEIGQALMHGRTFREFSSRHKIEQFELFDSWVETFMCIYRQDPCAVENPTVCVTDFRESGVFSDFNRFIQAFKRAGVPARFVDIRDLEFDGKHLRDRNDRQRIDAVYRRAVTSEVVQHEGECEGLIEAMLEHCVCVIGHFRTTVAHSKMVNVALFDESRNDFLTEEERDFVDAHLPKTYPFGRQMKNPKISDVLKDKNRWILKPMDDYGSHGVYPGVSFDSAEWEQIANEKLDSGYVVQEYCKPPKVRIVDSETDSSHPCEVQEWESMPGFFIYDGKLAGFYCRLGRGGVISLENGGLCSASFLVR